MIRIHNTFYVESFNIQRPEQCEYPRLGTRIRAHWYSYLKSSRSNITEGDMTAHYLDNSSVNCTAALCTAPCFRREIRTFWMGFCSKSSSHHITHRTRIFAPIDISAIILAVTSTRGRASVRYPAHKVDTPNIRGRRYGKCRSPIKPADNNIRTDAVRVAEESNVLHSESPHKFIKHPQRQRRLEIALPAYFPRMKRAIRRVSGDA